jgi:adenylate cyclase
MSKLTPGKEYERRFLVRAPLFTDAIRRAARQLRIRQGYLNIDPAQIRVRSTDGVYALEIKGKDDVELEPKPLSRMEGDLLLRDYRAPRSSVIEKVRHEIPAGFDGLTWEVDLFKGDNAPLMMAEIEMPRKKYPLEDQEWPAWIGDEVTDDPRFKNKNLAMRPFTAWPKAEQKKILKRMGR